ncbi:uncharacterized protein YdeI (YjbR/CyaY-like superfamily) [Leucobacter luti]|uniref:Uncharacterized protein YdeI (YjbR/CyaY-like superfamily) n=1 Tax=Leucobacter luti TaxID=340320 RepID=A0A4R6S037_9MICO|nr:YdeI/OmpD-associated family protein [Leucobacter luti]TDP92573.1 uncharacterized protein YdeI (YjbR/CyaY-like superfamily) [Leucobacter luti]
MTAATPPSPHCFADVEAWQSWLLANDTSSDGLWIVLAKKGTVSPTTLNYQEALEEALCSGWIDGQRKGRDEHTFMQRFTPRRVRSLWSVRNVDITARLEAEGRLRAGGIREIERAQADGRWDRAYAGSATAVAPAALTTALAAAPEAEAKFAALNSSDRYSALHPILTAPSEATRERRIAALVARFAEAGRTP